MKHSIDPVAPSSVDPYGNKSYHTDIVVWDGIEEITDAVLEEAKKPKNRHRWHVTFNVRTDADADHTAESWFGRDDLHGWATVREAVYGTWKQGMGKLDEFCEALHRVPLPVPRSIRRGMAWNEGNGDFDLDRFCEGRSYLRGPVKREVLNHQFITLVVQSGAGKTTHADDMIWRGACCIELATRLEEQGYSVEIVSVEYGTQQVYTGHGLPTERAAKTRARTTTRKYRDVLTAIWVKRAEETLNRSTLLNALSPWFFRTVGFASYCMIPGTTPDEFLGYSEDVPDRLIHRVAPGREEEDAWRVFAVWNLEQAVELASLYLHRLTPSDESLEYAGHD